jgi:hypothetical protein
VKPRSTLGTGSRGSIVDRRPGAPADADANLPSDRGRNMPRKPTTLKINVEESWQCRWWAEHLGVSRTELFAAILKVGVDADAVRKALGK